MLIQYLIFIQMQKSVSAELRKSCT